MEEGPVDYRCALLDGDDATDRVLQLVTATRHRPYVQYLVLDMVTSDSFLKRLP